VGACASNQLLLLGEASGSPLIQLLLKHGSPEDYDHGISCLCLVLLSYKYAPAGLRRLLLSEIKMAVPIVTWRRECSVAGP